MRQRRSGSQPTSDAIRMDGVPASDQKKIVETCAACSKDSGNHLCSCDRFRSQNVDLGIHLGRSATAFAAFKIKPEMKEHRIPAKYL